MRIDASKIILSSAHTSVTRYEKSESLDVWDNRITGQTPRDEAIISMEAKSLSRKDNLEEDSSSLPANSKYYILAQLISALTGEDVRILDPEKLNRKLGAAEVPRDQAAQPPDGGQQQEGWGVRYTATETYTEQEQTVFRAKGVVTAGGKAYEVNISLLMERASSTTATVDFRAGDALKDPLVINFGQNPATLSGQKTSFDIDSDGQTEEMPFVNPDSGFLVLDRNNDGIVTDGSELFGPSTGDGFSELGRYDENSDGWVDEADPSFNDLRLWVRNGEEETLYSLKDVNIGAFYLGSTKTPFELKNGLGPLEGMIQQTGIYLREDGLVGTIQKLDLVV
jgi:hypothetical protein